jgi:hypothetical protein
MKIQNELEEYEPPVIILAEVALETSFLTGSTGAGTEDLEDGDNVSVNFGA